MSAFMPAAAAGAHGRGNAYFGAARCGADCEIVLDLSRLLSRMLHPTPTGVDRVEMAYALGLQRLVPDRLRYSAIHPSGLQGRLPTSATADFLHMTADRWRNEGQHETGLSRWRRTAKACLALLPRPSRRTGAARIYLHCSARGLERRALIERILRHEEARFIPFVHDLIPLEYPEYARPSGAALFARKIQTVTALASGILVNSQATARALGPTLRGAGRPIPVQAAPLGVSVSATPSGGLAPDASGRPYFLAIATIEPRKNHLLLLHVWRRLIEVMGPAAAPKLVLVGRRGWENEMVIDLLDRTPAFKGCVEERSRVPDADLAVLTRGARAVLMPSFAEGYGLPVVEALALGTPVIASDLAALREAGGLAPDYLDPLDGVAWMEAIIDYSRPDSVRRAAQLARHSGWQAPSWDAHLGSVLDFIAEVAQ